MIFLPRSIFLRWIIFATSFTPIYSHAHGHGEEEPELEPFYEDCGKYATCLGLMAEKSKIIYCDTSECVATLVLMPPFPNEKDQTIHFHLRLNINEYGYMAVGLTTKSRMDEMLVLECLVDVDLTAYSYISWNQATPSNPSPSSPFSPPERIYGAGVKTALSKPPAGTNISFPIHEEGVAFCDYFLPKKFTIKASSQSITFDLVKPTYSVAIVVGVVDDGESCPYVKSPPESGPTLCKHRVVGVRKFKLLDIQFLQKDNNAILHQLHAFLMVFAYFTLMPIATIVSRYFRETWSSRQLCNKRIWFPIHIVLLYFGFLCTVAAYVCQAVSHKAAWPDGEHSKGGPPHAAIGMTSMAIFFTQITLPWVIPSGKLTLRKVYSFLHALLGSVCYGLGVLNIVLTPVLMPEAANCEVIFITFVWMGCHFCLYWLFATLLVLKDHQMLENDSRFRALISYPMRLQTTGDAPGKTKRKVFLGIFIVLSLLMSGGMSYQIFQAEVECALYMKQSLGAEAATSTTPRSDARW